MTINVSYFNSSSFERFGISVRNAPIPQETIDYFREKQEADAAAGNAAPLAEPASTRQVALYAGAVGSPDAAFLAQLLAYEVDGPQHG